MTTRKPNPLPPRRAAVVQVHHHHHYHGVAQPPAEARPVAVRGKPKAPPRPAARRV